MVYPIPAFIFFGLFIMASILQLFFAFIENQKFRKREKFLCLLMLGLASAFAFPDQPLIYIGAFLGMIGDILVLRKRTFVTGTVAFLLGHFCYLFETLFLIIGINNISYWQPIVIILSFLISFFVMVYICATKTNHSKFDVVAQSFYFSTQIMYIPVFIFSILIVNKLMWLSLVGALLFIFSDSLIVKTHFGSKFKRYDFYIMLTYLLAEALIITGFALTIIK